MAVRTSDTSSIPSTVNPDWRIGIITAPFYQDEIDSLYGSAEEALLEAGLPPENILRYDVPGSFEIPLIGAKLAKENAVDALIGIGIVVEGETQHARLLAEAATQGMMDIQVQYQIPFGFEVLYVDSIEQARERLGKGREAAIAVLGALHAIRSIDDLV